MGGSSCVTFGGLVYTEENNLCVPASHTELNTILEIDPLHTT